MTLRRPRRPPPKLHVPPPPYHVAQTGPKGAKRWSVFRHATKIETLPEGARQRDAVTRAWELKRKDTEDAIQGEETR